jgi:filamentous hemagglutinin family protein
MYPIKPTLCLLGLLLPLSLSVQVQAQVIPANDGTGTEVAPNGDIKGGQTTGTNLFHSFQQFDVNAGKTANFVPNAGITNILGRVAGNAPSVINGTIQVTGNANLYLMNPAGLIFGQGAVLNVPGSFVGTTANAIGFGDGKWFNAVGSNAYKALTGNPTGFAFTTAQPGGIFNAANLESIDSRPEEEKPGNRIGGLTLVGGTVVSTGKINIPGGNINIASVAGGKFVRISQTGRVLSLEFPLQDLSAEQKVKVNQTSLIPSLLPALLANRPVNEAAGVVLANGRIKLIGSDTVVANGDIVTRDISSGTKAFLSSGNISLNAQNSIEVGELLSGNSLVTDGTPEALGTLYRKPTGAGDISLATQTGNIITKLIFTGTGNGTGSIGGKGGNININSANLFRVTGFLSTDSDFPDYRSIIASGNIGDSLESKDAVGSIKITHRGTSFVTGAVVSADFKSIATPVKLFDFPENGSGTLGAIDSRVGNGAYRVVLADGNFFSVDGNVSANIGNNGVLVTPLGVSDGFKITQLPPITADKPPVIVTPPVPPTDNRGAGGGTGGVTTTTTGTTTTGTGTGTTTTGTGTGTTGTGTGTTTTGTGTGTTTTGTGTGTTTTGTTTTETGKAADPQNQVANKTKEFCDRQSSTTIATNTPPSTRSASIDKANQEPLDPCQAFIKGDRILRIVE